MNEVLAEAMIEKVDSLGKDIGKLREKVEGLPDYSEAFEKMMGEMKAVKRKGTASSFSGERIESINLESERDRLLAETTGEKRSRSPSSHS